MKEKVFHIIPVSIRASIRVYGECSIKIPVPERVNTGLRRMFPARKKKKIALQTKRTLSTVVSPITIDNRSHVAGTPNMSEGFANSVQVLGYT